MNESLLQREKSETEDPGKEKENPPAAAPGGQKPRRALLLKLFLCLGLISLVVLGVYGIMTRSAHTENLQKEANQAIGELAVEVVKPQKAPATITVDLPGQTQAYTQASLYAQTTGYVKKWNFEIGAHVKEGDLLAEIDTPQVDQELDQAKATLRQAQAALDLAQITFARDRDLLQRNVIARQDFDTAQDNFRRAQSTVNSDEAAVLRLEALENFKRIMAPFDGIVTARNTDLGSMVNAGSGTPLFVVARTKPLRVYINVPESMATDVTVGASAELDFSEFPGKTFPGEVVRTAGAIDSTSRTLLTEIKVPNEDGQLFPGAYTQVRLSTGGRRQSLLIPANTLLFRSEGTMVGVVGADNKVELKKVQIGKDLGTRLEVIQGLSPDDQVILNPSVSLTSGQTVRTRTPKHP
ncbi:MAG: efflux RND transporter periplasmic adaptor subunit [Verrucomicrobia bacterium]|nr:efflux RND transporter periplasmic adaptor subunit [Verrucomicrobiota bacterium]